MSQEPWRTLTFMQLGNSHPNTGVFIPLIGMPEPTSTGRHGFTSFHIRRANGHSHCSEWQQAQHTFHLTYLIPHSHLPKSWVLGCSNTEQEEGLPWMVHSAAESEGHLLQWPTSMQMQLISQEQCRSLSHYRTEKFCKALCNALGSPQTNSSSVGVPVVAGELLVLKHHFPHVVKLHWGVERKAA